MQMKVNWLGQAAFLITSDSGTKIITDPYGTNEMLTYDEINESADIVTVSHDHFDHANVDAVGGNPEVVKGAAEVKGIKFDAVSTYHDNSGGSERGSNTIFCFEVDGVRLCHLGDLGHLLSDKQVADIGKVDILLIPVGGNFTIDAKAATEVAGKLSPKVIIPMHYQNDRCPTFPVAGVDGFLEGKDNVTKPGVSEMEFSTGNLPAATQIVVLKPAR
jgi:L-ascorbate metabolism protein UlaG (beta-lactamase superfamily)